MQDPDTLGADDPRWQAIFRRQPATGFVYSVTGAEVYCRPECKVRQVDERTSVRCFDSALAAEGAGLRACKRCRPDRPRKAEQEAAAVAAACRLIESEAHPPPLDTLAEAAGISPFHFHRLFKRLTGLTPKDYAESCRKKRLQQRLQEAERVTDAMYEAGFNSSARFYAHAHQTLGMSPKTFRSGGQGEQIRFALGESVLGGLLVAATVRGVCAVSLGDDHEQLLQELQDRFPKAELIGADAEFEGWMAQVVGLINTSTAAPELPLDVRGTVFQQKVWQALRAIPPGSTASYAEIAMRIGAPRAVRAVAQACAANTLAVAIPCHRVVRTDGSLSGYRWGVERKRALLDREVRLRD